jgi:hypothetical protein
MNDTFSAIRCPNERPHGHYSLCGRLLGITVDKKIYLYCEDCKNFFEIVILDNNLVEMSPLPKNMKLRLQTAIRAIIK